MSSQLQAINLGGNVIWVEVSDIPAQQRAQSEFAQTSQDTDSVAKVAADQLAKVDIGPMLKAVIGPVYDALKDAGPEEVGVELSIGIKGEVGFFVAKGEGNASLKVSAKWKFPPAQ
jgi:hypothetical protein